MYMALRMVIVGRNYAVTIRGSRSLQNGSTDACQPCQLANLVMLTASETLPGMEALQ